MTDAGRNAGWPVLIEARHVRLSATHIELLFGVGHRLLELVFLPPTGRFASADVVDVRGASGVLKGVRVLGPVASATRVYLSDDDIADCGIDVDRTAGLSVDGPRGTLVLGGTDAVFDVRRLVVPRATSAPAPGASIDLVVHSERARELRGVRVEASDDAQAVWLGIDVSMANALDVGPATHADARGAALP